MLLLEIWLDIVPYLSLRELLRLTQLSKSLRELTDSHRVWTTLCRRHDLPLQSKSIDKKTLVLDYIRSKQSLLHGTDDLTPWSEHGMGAVHLHKIFQDRILSGGWDGEIKLHNADGYLLSSRIVEGSFKK